MFTVSFLARSLLTTLSMQALATPLTWPNSSLPVNSTVCNSTLSFCNVNDTTGTAAPPEGPVIYRCIENYPADLTVLNQRYPDYKTDHLHQARQFFMLRRQLAGDGEIATRVQFSDLPLNTSNTTCRLEFVLPDTRLQRIRGPNPSFNVYQVEREEASIATWDNYEGNSDNAEVFGTVNGEPQALERTRSVGGVAAINATNCNETMIFQMGMKYESASVPNYWEFSNVMPPAWPVQGFRIVYGC